MTAEFAVAVPAMLMVLALAVGAILLATHRIVLTSGAAELARLESRGDGAGAAARLAALGGGVSVTREHTGALHCVTLSDAPAGGLLALVRVSARACAATVDGGGGS